MIFLFVTFPIQEESLSDYLKSHVTIDSEAYGREVAEQIVRPLPVPGIKKAMNHQVKFVDISRTIEEDVTLPDGTILTTKGTVINPLERITLPDGILFFDGTDLEQVDWAKLQPSEFKWILINGCPLALEIKENRPVYFDQFGFLTAHFQIEFVPAKVMQEGSRLRIEEGQ